MKITTALGQEKIPGCLFAKKIHQYTSENVKMLLPRQALTKPNHFDKIFNFYIFGVISHVSRYIGVFSLQIYNQGFFIDPVL